MPSCHSILLRLWACTAAFAGIVCGFLPSLKLLPQSPLQHQPHAFNHHHQEEKFNNHMVRLTSCSKTTSMLLMVAEKVEVCSFKDCKSRGGGPRLVKQIGEILEEKGMTLTIAVEPCDCQGECGYGPNLLVDGNLINNVKGREAILKALGIEE